MENDNLRMIDGGNTPSAISESVRQMRANLPYFIDQVSLIAELQKAKFDALTRNGFTDAQALELCKSVF